MADINAYVDELDIANGDPVVVVPEEGEHIGEAVMLGTGFESVGHLAHHLDYASGGTPTMHIHEKNVEKLEGCDKFEAFTAAGEIEI